MEAGLCGLDHQRLEDAVLDDRSGQFAQ